MEKLVSLQGVTKNFHVTGGTLKAVDNVSFDIHRGETVGLVGESGCGKSTLGRVVMGVYQASEGKIIYEGKELNIKSGKDRYEYAKKAQMIFQDPYASLNPRMTVGSIISEGMEIHNMYDAKARSERVDELLELVGLNKEFRNRFPHEFSGGQRQRIGIARALAIEPEFLVCDEPISALDISIQSQIINLLIDLQRKLNLSYLFIAHDLDIVRYISDRIVVMYLGNVVEIASSEEVYNRAMHPYTQALLSAVPIPDPELEKKKQRIILEGDVPSPINLPDGCPFAARCAHATDRCRSEKPVLREIEKDHFVACHIV
ncbi:MAG: ATP-binding cassette domain-containing protein [Bacilli bacterium]|nr:ATP-binding cassette domain-containing protein [Bacilli bacterium]